MINVYRMRSQKVAQRHQVPIEVLEEDPVGRGDGTPFGKVDVEVSASKVEWFLFVALDEGNSVIEVLVGDVAEGDALAVDIAPFDVFHRPKLLQQGCKILLSGKEWQTANEDSPRWGQVFGISAPSLLLSWLLGLLWPLPLPLLIQGHSG